ncbi:MAG: LysR family transcriptional regulator, partial [Xanthobacteraceae bacterium]
AAVRAGLGIGFIQTPLAKQAPSLLRLAPDIEYRMEVWVAAHPQLAKVPRVAATLDTLSSGLQSFGASGG